MSAFPFIILFSVYLLAEHSMDQDVYGGYSKQQLGSLTTDGEGESRVVHHGTSGISEKRAREADLRAEQTCT
jgi:hypothetical protein